MKFVEVMAGWLNPEEKIGDLYFESNRGDKTFSFEYNSLWLKNHRINIDPDLELYPGRQYASDNKVFGVFSDSAPDRWGRTLIRRREQHLAKKEGRPRKKLNESDYLLGISDELRTGAVRFKDPGTGTYLAYNEQPEVPAFENLHELEAVSKDYEDDPEKNESWLKELIVPGSSLGGARPKATVQMPNGELWIAKFPSRHDEFDSGAWEKTVYDLAEMVGLETVQTQLKKFSENGSTFLIQRFDRRVLPDGNIERTHFVSSMTLLGMNDGEGASSGNGYTEIADFINSNGSRPYQDLRELFARVVFSMCVSNTDDHFRNHGFILDKKGWRLSPVYDLNPNPEGRGRLSLTVSYDDNRFSLANLTDFAELISISVEEAADICFHIAQTVKNNWELLARRNEISKREIKEMEEAFSFCDEILAAFVESK